jgi:hypothetical protein
MSREVPRSFRRESRLFLWIALLLILFVNFVTLLFFRNAVAWGELGTERRAGEILRRLSLAAGPERSGEAIERTALEPDVVFVGVYDERGRLLPDESHTSGSGSRRCFSLHSPAATAPTCSRSIPARAPRCGGSLCS